MLREEISKTLQSKRSLFIFLFLIAVSIADNISGILQAKFGSYEDAHPAVMSLLSGQSGIIFYALFFWMLPITIVLLYSSRFNQECKNNLNCIYISKTGRRKHFLSKLGSSFIITDIYVGIPLILNLLVSIIFLHGGTSFQDAEKWPLEYFSLDGDSGYFLYYCVHHPYLGWLIYFLLALIVCGLVGIMTQCIAVIFKDNLITLAVSFAVWITLFSIKYNITTIIQPFTEYGLSYMFKSFLILFFIVAVVFIVSCISMVINKDEI